jgi:hypothetical protein
MSEVQMSALKFSKKGQELIKLYEQMVREGYDRMDQQRVNDAFSDFELRAYRPEILSMFKSHSISTVLDYGCGGSDWRASGFDDVSGHSAIEYFKLQNAYRYEPARDIDERQRVDCVISFDVLEHIFISDVPSVLRDMFSYATKLIVLNVACYPAAAKLPNGENAHITVRHPLWWKGMIDSISIEYPAVSVFLVCSSGWRMSNAFPVWNANSWQESSSFVVAN